MLYEGVFRTTARAIVTEDMGKSIPGNERYRNVYKGNTKCPSRLLAAANEKQMNI